MATKLGRDRLRGLVDVIVDSIDDWATGPHLAKRAYLSRYYFDRLVSEAIGESPGFFRRRLLLERAAYELASTDASVTEVAIGAGYGSLEAFTHAFGREYGVPPSVFRQSPPESFWLPSPNRIHFHPPAGLTLPPDERRPRMHLTDRMVEYDNWLTERLLEAAAQLPDDALDEPVPLHPLTAAFDEEAPSIRSMLNRLVFTKEMWSAAIIGRAFARDDDRTIQGMKRRLDRSGNEFVELVADIDKRDAWDTAFVDALCEPPESFTFGGAVSHVLSWDAHRRLIVAGVLRARGVDVPSADPIVWERER